MCGSGTTKAAADKMGVVSHLYDLHSGFDLMNSDIPERPEFIFWHPPYWDIIKYSGVMYNADEVKQRYGYDPTQHDLSCIATWDEFVSAMNFAMMKQFAALEKGGRMAVLMGDIKKKGRLYSMIAEIAKPGTLENIIIKAQHNCVSDRTQYMRTYSAIAAKYYPDPAHRPTWYHTQQLMSNGTLQVPADEQPKPFISNAPSYQWLRSGGWDEDLIVDAEPAVTTKCGRPMSSARASQTVGMMPAYYGEVADDLLKLVRLRKGEFSAEMQQRLLFYIYVYSVLKISCKRDGDAPAVEAVRAADALMRHPMTPEMLEQRIAGLRASVRYDRTSVSKKRVISDLQITVAEQKQLKRLLGHEEDLRRKSKSGMLRSERDTALDTAIVEMLAQGKLHREIGEKLGMARESVTRRIRRNNLLREVQEARNALAKEQARAKKAEKTKNKDDDDKNGGARAGGTQAASKPQKKSSRKPLSESRWLAVLAVQRVRRAKERLARKCSICIRNLAKRYYRLNAARVEWISGVSAAKSLCATPFPQLC